MTRAQERTKNYTEALPTHSANSLTVITSRTAVETRAHAPQATLLTLGVTDVTMEGSLVLGGQVEITPGLRKGVPDMKQVDLRHAGPRLRTERVRIVTPSLRSSSLRAPGSVGGRGTYS
jgi:hypothetical protein